MKRLSAQLGAGSLVVAGALVLTVSAPALAVPARPMALDARAAVSAAATIPQIDFEDAIHADVGASVFDPARDQAVWVFGDALQIGDESEKQNLPHSEFGVQDPGSATLTILPGPYGHADSNGNTWQQVPDGLGTYFWPSDILLDGSSLWVFGASVNDSSGVVGDTEVAQFSAKTLAYDGITDLTALGAGRWGFGNAIPATGGGSWLIGTQNVCSGTNNCKAGAVFWIPPGAETDPASWQGTADAFPTSLDVGTIVSPVADGAAFLAFTKQGDEYGSNTIEELSAPSMTGPWQVSASWPTPATANCPAPPTVSDCKVLTYSVEAHPEDSAGDQLMLTYAVNGPTQYWLNQLDITYANVGA
jgi:hypothetical protein